MNIASSFKDLIDIQMNDTVFKRCGDGTYFQKTSLGKNTVRYIIVPYDQIIKVNINVSIRIDRVQDFPNIFPPTASNKTIADSSTVTCDIGNYIHGRQKYWYINEEVDINHTIDEIFQYFNKYGNTFYRDLDSMEKMFQLLLENDQKAITMTHFADSRAKKIVALALVMKMPNIPNIIEKMIEKFNDSHNRELAEFNRFLETVDIKT